MIRYMHGINAWLSRLPKTTVFLLALLQVFTLGTADLAIENAIVFSVFYLIPVTMAAWFAGRRQAIIVSVLSVVMLFADDVSSRLISPQSILVYWDAAVRLGFFLVISYALAALRQSYEYQKDLARTDPLTGLANSRAFYERASIELERAKRCECSLTVAYMDIDDFKHINDTYGHAVGDYILRKVGRTIQDSTRDLDVVARMGGDEFVILMCQADRKEAGKVIKRIQTNLTEEMKAHRWSVSLSVGMVSFRDPKRSITEVITAADKLMYKVKMSGKNSILQETI